MSDTLDGRQIAVWRGRDPREDLTALADAITATNEVYERTGN
jgi:hypothetical protein